MPSYTNPRVQGLNVCIPFSTQHDYLRIISKSIKRMWFITIGRSFVLEKGKKERDMAHSKGISSQPCLMHLYIQSPCTRMSIPLHPFPTQPKCCVSTYMLKDTYDQYRLKHSLLLHELWRVNQAEQLEGQLNYNMKSIC